VLSSKAIKKEGEEKGTRKPRAEKAGHFVGYGVSANGIQGKEVRRVDQLAVSLATRKKLREASRRWMDIRFSRTSLTQCCKRGNIWAVRKEGI
jgi:hypothetical protein